MNLIKYSYIPNNLNTFLNSFFHSCGTSLFLEAKDKRKKENQRKLRNFCQKQSPTNFSFNLLKLNSTRMSSDESDEEQVDYEDDSEDESEDGVAGGFRGEDVRQSSEEDVHSKSLEERLKEMEEEKEQRAFRHDSVRNSVRQKRLGAEGASEGTFTHYILIP